MKARPLFLGVLSAALCAIAAPAQTETKPAPAPTPVKADNSGQMEKRRQEMLKRFDLNGDGKLDEAEKAAMKETLKQEKTLRGSGDIGSLGAPAAPVPGPGGEVHNDRFFKELIKRFDRDGDGKLDASELADMEAARQQMQQNGGGARFREQMLKMFDRNGDGVLDEAERAEAAKFREEQIKRFDKNGDGKLDQEERAEALKAFLAEHPDMAPPPGQ
jgi:Ca2+-binding EF-hand superfamily protein